jgi:hypothetical protein
MVKSLATVRGVEIKITPDLKRRLSALLPVEAMPGEDYMRLSPDKDFCMSEMKRSMQNNMSETAWPVTQYLWKLHPLFNWINDKAGLLYGRGEAPLVGLPIGLSSSEYLFVVAGTIPNRKSAPVVDEWFGLLYQNGSFVKELTMDEVLVKTKFGKSDLPNRKMVSKEKQQSAAALLSSVVDKSKEFMQKQCDSYNSKINPQIDEEIDKLSALQGRHMDYQLSLFEDDRRKSEQQRKVEKTFDDFVNWVKDTLEIENNPYIRIAAVFVGVNE